MRVGRTIRKDGTFKLNGRTWRATITVEDYPFRRMGWVVVGAYAKDGRTELFAQNDSKTVIGYAEASA